MNFVKKIYKRKLKTLKNIKSDIEIMIYINKNFFRNKDEKMMKRIEENIRKLKIIMNNVNLINKTLTEDNLTKNNILLNREIENIKKIEKDLEKITNIEITTKIKKNLK